MQEASTLGHIGHRNVGQQATETNRQQQQGLKALLDRQIDQQDAHCDHKQLTNLDVVQARALPEFEELIHYRAP
ncbi:hypothetical protein D3C72_1859420 [compost metagenome]